ncbi:zinc-dependent alcohol dehydrogenase [Synergistales bacterium]|nr:zinc-dependent alcohol dehydrogenase [Synergistales bacterium]
MKAAVLREYKSPLVIVDKPIPEPAWGEVLVKVMASGLCVSDLHIQDGIISTVRLPFTPGHEMAGVIAKTGEGVANVKVGDHVTASVDLICHKCRYCRDGRTNLCTELVRIGFETDGSHEEYCVIPEENAFKVADHIPFEQVAGLPDAVGCMYHALKTQAKVNAGQVVLILGTGGLGMNAIQLVKVLGAKAYATSRQKDKLETSLQMGADAVINTKEQTLRSEVARLTGGAMCDVVIDNIGIKTSVEEALNLVCPGGKVIVTGYNDPTFEANFQNIMKLEKEIIGTRAVTRTELAEVVNLAEEKKIVPYVYKTIPFEDINEGLGMLRNNSAKGRVVLMMGEV